MDVGELTMPGNSQRRGAMRNTGSKKGAQVGSGGARRKGLKGRGPTPKATERPHHPAAKRKRVAEKRAAKSGSSTSSSSRRRTDSSTLMGRNAIVEALRAGIPAKALYVQSKADSDERWREALKLAVHRDIPIMEVSRQELDRMCDGGVHQGLVLSVPPFAYAELDTLKGAEILVALDGVTDPRNLGAIARSAAAFGAQGLVIPSRRTVGVTASAWKASAGALTRIPVVQVTNLTRTLQGFQQDGFIVVGLAGDAEVDLDQMRTDVLADRIVLVVGSEGAGLSRLVRESCDWVVRIPMHDATESLNASVAASLALYAVANART
jgi:23S rRNA (guanosine2251-2'-O)-methyltransferase